MRCNSRGSPALLFISGLFSVAACQAAEVDNCKVKAAVEQVIKPVMEKNALPGMAVGVSVDGQRCVYNFGVMSRDTKQSVTDDTLFEIGSISKMFTATLATYAQADGKLALTGKASEYLPQLRGSAFDKVSVLNLGTNTAGGLPLQVPGEVRDADQLMAYYRHWKPDHVAGSSRTYSNPSSGLLGIVVAASLQMPFDVAMEKQLFPAFGLTHTYLSVPAGQMQHYAQGHTWKDEPVRLSAGPVALYAYGVKTSATDLLRFLEHNMQPGQLDAKWQRAVRDTQVPRYQIGPMTQGFSWEMYPYPLKLDVLLAGNSEQIVFKANATAKPDMLQTPPVELLVNKTGSTAGFSSYVAFVPARRIGVVLLANKAYPMADRVTAGYNILARLNSSQ